MSSSSNIHFFLGENAFELLSEKKLWVGEFTKKHGFENISQFDGAKVQQKDLLDEVASMPFIAEKRLVVVDGPMKWKKAEVENLLSTIHPDVLLLFVAVIGADKKGATPAGMKAIEAVASMKKFPKKSASQVKKWVQEQCDARGSSVSASALDSLMAVTGGNQIFLSQEIEKLSTYASGRTIELEDVETLTFPSAEQEVWTLLNLLTSGKVDEALLFARSLLDRGESAHSLWARLLWLVSQLGLVQSAIEEGVTSVKEVSSLTGVNFFSCKTMVPCAQKMKTDTVRIIVSKMADADIAVKTGVIKATAEAPEELEALIDESLLLFKRG